MYLVGDVGGTKTRLALFETNRCVKEKSYVSKEFKDLFDIIELFLKSEKPLQMACFGIAGPIRNNCVKTTNLPWEIDGNKLSEKLGKIQTFLINDLKANAWGLKALKEDQLFVLNKGNPVHEGNRALISAGTGLGEAGLYFNRKEHLPFASEGGHASFAPNSKLEVELVEHLLEKYDHVSWERLVSGMGIYEIFQFLHEIKGEKLTQEVESKMKTEDPSAVISEAAIKKCDNLCNRVMEWFLSLYGAEAGNVALKFLSLGGVYIGGGIAPKVLSLLKEKPTEFPSFMDSFFHKGRMKELLKDIPVKVVLEEKTALLGAVEYLNSKNAK